MPLSKIGDSGFTALNAKATGSTGGDEIVFDAGPGAIVAGFISYLMKLLIEQQGKDAEMGIIQAQVQGDSAQASYKASLESAAATQASQYKEAIGRAASAGLSFVDAAGTKLYQMKTMDAPIAEVNESKTVVSDLKTLAQKTPITALNVGQNAAVQPVNNSDVNELLNGKYAIGPQRSEQAIKDMTPDQREELKKSLETEHARLETALGTLSGNKNALANQTRYFTDMATNTATSTTGFLSANDGQEAGKSKAEADLLSAAQQSAGQGYSTAMDNLRRHYEAVTALLGLLRQATSINGNG